MVSDILLNVPVDYIIVSIPFILCLIQLYIVFLVSKEQKATSEKLREVKEMNNKLVEQTLNLLKSNFTANKEFMQIEEKNVELLEKLTDLVDKRGI